MDKSTEAANAIKRGSLVALATVALSAAQPLAVSAQTGDRTQTARPAPGSGNARESRQAASPCTDATPCKPANGASKNGGFTGIPGRPNR
jgi:hypothetical protein